MENALDYIRKTYEKIVGKHDMDMVMRPVSEWKPFDVRPLTSGNTGDHRDVIAVRAAPGNGTEYRFVLTNLSGAEDLFGCQDGSWLIAMDPYWKSGTAIVRDYGDIHPSYLEEKLKMNEHDSAVMAVILYRVKERLSA